MKKLFFAIAVMFVFTLFVSGCGTAQDLTDGINNVNDSIQNVNKAVEDVNKGIQDVGNPLSPDKETSGSGESGANDNNAEPEEDNEEDSEED